MRYVICISFLACSIVGYSQLENVPMSLGFSAGIDMQSNKDLAASPLLYSGFGLPIGFNGFKLNNKWLSHFELQLILPLISNNYPLKTNVKTQLKEWGKVNLNYGLLKSIGPNSLDFIGAGVQSSFFIREYDFLDGLSWEFQGSLSINYARKVNLSDKSFLLPQIRVPVFSYINRKSSLTFDEPFLDDFYNEGPLGLLKYGKWKFRFDEWMAFDFSLLYHLRISDRMNFQSDAGFSYYSIRFPEEVSHLNIPIRCHLNYQF